MRRGRFRGLLGLLLAIVMVLSIVPGYAFAQDGAQVGSEDLYDEETCTITLDLNGLNWTAEIAETGEIVESPTTTIELVRNEEYSFYEFTEMAEKGGFNFPWNETPVEGKIFLGFTTVKDDKSTLVQSPYDFEDEEGEYTRYNYYLAQEDQTLYAYWEDSCTIIWEGNGHQIVTGVYEDESGEYVTEVTDSYEELVPVGTVVYPFGENEITDIDHAKELLVGWTSIQNDRSTLKINLRSSTEQVDWFFKATGDEVLYAYFGEAAMLTLNYNGGHAYDAPDVKKEEIVFEKGTHTHLPWLDTEPYHEGDVMFVGWAFDKDGREMVEPVEVQYGDETHLEYALAIDEDTEVFAIWKDVVRITFVSTSSQILFRDYIDDENYQLVERITYEFAEGEEVYQPMEDSKDSHLGVIGYSTDEFNKNPIDLSKWKATKDMTVYTIASKIIHVVFDGNGGKISGEDSITMISVPGQRISIDSEEMTHENSDLVFIGWNTLKDSISASKEVLPTTDKTYYAIWQKKNTPMVPVYRMYNPKTGEHLFTTDVNEKNVLSSERFKWKYEGVAWYAPQTGEGVYRLFNPKTGQHLYTVDPNEVHVLTTKWGWRKDFNGKPLFYSGGGVSIYRVFNPRQRIGSHHWTTDENEYNALPKHGWSQEGVKFYAIRKGDF